MSDLQVYYGSVCVAQTEVYAMNSVRVAGSVFADNNNQKGNIGVLTVVLYLFGGVFVIGLIGFAVLFLIRSGRIVKMRRLSRRNSRNRRRSR